jgi:hypothetical protein
VEDLIHCKDVVELGGIGIGDCRLNVVCITGTVAHISNLRKVECEFQTADFLSVVGNDPVNLDLFAGRNISNVVAADERVIIVACDEVIGQTCRLRVGLRSSRSGSSNGGVVRGSS